jgi:hypothetical protein
VGAGLFQADRRTHRQADMTKLIGYLSNFVIAPKNSFKLIA